MSFGSDAKNFSKVIMVDATTSHMSCDAPSTPRKIYLPDDQGIEYIRTPEETPRSSDNSQSVCSGGSTPRYDPSESPRTSDDSQDFWRARSTPRYDPSGSPGSSDDSQDFWRARSTHRYDPSGSPGSSDDSQSVWSSGSTPRYDPSSPDYDASPEHDSLNVRGGGSILRYDPSESPRSSGLSQSVRSGGSTPPCDPSSPDYDASPEHSAYGRIYGNTPEKSDEDRSDWDDWCYLDNLSHLAFGETPSSREINIPIPAARRRLFFPPLTSETQEMSSTFDISVGPSRFGSRRGVKRTYTDETTLFCQPTLCSYAEINEMTPRISHIANLPPICPGLRGIERKHMDLPTLQMPKDE